MKHPEATDIADIAALLFPWVPRIAFELTAIMLLLNNVMLVGFHVFTGAKSEYRKWYFDGHCADMYSLEHVE
jgi:hypothetical protein